ncbi:response regulator transcription factor [Jidongwangia harbinensis]|uniref:response regulator transcription factor n=1 Tax=Jidongwangia harbinensis TaxID=2878561 RepID=UPI001CD98E03|nr:response regulator transcription factor [Jidongwangia harbinensis]MCA2217362.1 response regulator transcription factor [Jidongwangia harbinensis]
MQRAESSPIRVAVVQDAPLYRGALAAAFRSEGDLEVIAEVPVWQEVVALPVAPDLTVLDLDGAGDDPLVAASAIRRAVPGTRVLILLAADRHDVLAGLGPDDMDKVGFVTKRASLDHLLSALRSLVNGNAVIDPELVASLLVQPENPLTGREREVLALTAQGMPTDEVARKLNLSAGTVRNCLSRITAKTGADSRVDAINRARRAGWL